MRDRRLKSIRWSARFMAVGGLISLFAGQVCCVQAAEPADKTTISAQPIRRPVLPDTGKIILWESREGSGTEGEKAEISVYQLYSMEFGALCRKSGYVVLGIDDAIVDNPDHLVYGGVPYSGVIQLEGDANRPVTIEITASVNDGLQLSHFNTDLGAPPLLSQTLDDLGNLTFQLGARLTLDAGEIQAGTAQQISYTITTFYE
ncbi:MAG: hypothetical protein PHQ53_01490 [Candidatus Krumholzibacteria bacterium]|nr:hypothetical protein [Candidatus Krumholzibacteria bacterium]